QRRRLLRDARRLALEAECDDVLPTRLRTRAAVRARVAAKLRHAVADGHRVDAAAALDVLLLDVGSLGGDEHLALGLRAHERLRDLHLRPRERTFGAQAEV